MFINLAGMIFEFPVIYGIRYEEYVEEICIS